MRVPLAFRSHRRTWVWARACMCEWKSSLGHRAHIRIKYIQFLFIQNCLCAARIRWWLKHLYVCIYKLFCLKTGFSTPFEPFKGCMRFLFTRVINEHFHFASSLARSCHNFDNNTNLHRRSESKNRRSNAERWTMHIRVSTEIRNFNYPKRATCHMLFANRQHPSGNFPFSQLLLPLLDRLLQFFSSSLA